MPCQDLTLGWNTEEGYPRVGNSFNREIKPSALNALSTRLIFLKPTNKNLQEGIPF